MKPGPDQLSHAYLRRIVKKHKKVIKRYYCSAIEWPHESLAGIKREIREHLRLQQQDRCIFCRRKIKLERRNAYEDIEHFLDKSKPKYRNWAFSCFNLSIACRACNLEKSTRDLGSMHRLGEYPAYPKGVGVFNWIHPYFDRYHDNISIGPGWTYSVRINAPAAQQASRMIMDCKLYEIQRVESYAESIKQTIYDLTIEIGKELANNNYERVAELVKASQELQDENRFSY